MAKTQLYFYTLLIISCQCSEIVQVQCPKLCQCENIEDSGIKIKCENVKDIKDISFGENSSEIIHLWVKECVLCNIL